MRTRMLLFACLLLLVTNYCNAQTWQWTHPETGIEDEPGHDIATDSTGNVYVLGDYTDTLYLNNAIRETGSSGSFLAKYDSTGVLLWYKLIKPVQNALNNHRINASDMVINAKGIFIIGNYTPGTASYACGFVQNPVNYDYNIGSFTFTSPVGDLGIYICRLNLNGGVVWNDPISFPLCTGDITGAGTTDYHPLIATDKNNNVISSFTCAARPHLSLNGTTIPLHYYISGGYQLVNIKQNFNGVVAWSNYAYNDGGTGGIENFTSSVCDNNGNLFLDGTAGDQSQFGSVQFHTSFTNPTVLAKISASGTWQSVHELASSSFNTLRVSGFGNPDLLTVDNANNVYALVTNNTGSYTTKYIYGNPVVDTPGVPNMYIVKTTNAGNLIWYKNFGTYGASSFSGGDVNSIFYANKNLYITGGLSVYNGSINNYARFSKITVPAPACGGGYNYFVAKADTTANFIWATDFCAVSNTVGLAVCAFGTNVYTSGYYRQGITSLGNSNTPVTFQRDGDNLFLGKLKDQYIKIGAVAPTNIIPGCTLTVPFTSTGLTFSGSNTFTAELSNASGDFTSPTAIGTTTSTGTGSITATIPASLLYGSGYMVRIRSSDTLKTGYNYYAYADTGYKLSLTCPPPSAGFTATNITGTLVTLNWTAVGCAAGYRVQYRVKGTTAWITKNIATNTPTTNLAGLTANTTYQWHVATKCINNATTSFSAYSATKLFTTAAAFAGNSSLIVNGAGSALGETNDLQVLLQPNPTSSQAILVINGTLQNATVRITDLAGKIIWKTGVVNTNRLMLPTGNFAAGIYLVTLVNGSEKKVVKLVKE